MKIYAHVSPDGAALGFYTSDIHGLAIDENGQPNPAIPADVIEIGADIWQNWIGLSDTRRYDRTTGQLVPVTPTEPTLHELRERALQRVAARRYEREIGGMVWQGMAIKTDRESQAKLSAAYQAARDNWRTEGAPWKLADGTTAALSNAQLIELAKAVAFFVQELFNEEAAAINSISDSDDVEFLKSILTAD